MNANKIKILTFILMFLSLGGAAVNAQTRTKFARVSGKNFVAPDGKILRLKGINLGNWLLPEGYMFEFKKANASRNIHEVVNELIGESAARKFWKQFQDNYITAEDIKFIGKSGFNSVRVPFNYRLLVSENDPNRLEGVGYELLDRVIDWCKREKIYVILDLHAAPGGQTGDNIDDGFGYPFLYESAEDQDLTVKIWQKLAARYKNEPTVLGYDLLNEPIATYFDQDYFNPKLEPLYRKITAGIRENDKNHIIFLGGAQWDGNFKVFGAPFDKNAAYTFHKYWFDVNRSAIQDYVDFSNKYNVPVWMGESGENTDEWIASFRELLDKNQIGWCFWTYKRLNATATVVSVNEPGNWSEIVKFAESPRTTFEEIRKARPPKEKIDAALKNYLEQIKLSNCRVNDGYLKALGLK